MTDHEHLESLLKRRTRFARLVHVASCDSTQALAAGEAVATDRGPDEAVFWADHQTQGRGRRQRSWHDEAGQDLAVTFRVRAHLPQPTALPAALPVAVLQACEPLVGRPLRIKWPNDVFVDDQKLAGVLVDRDSRSPDVYRIGIGVNVNRTRFPAELAAIATSLALATGHTFDRSQLLLHLAEQVDTMLSRLAAGQPGDHEQVFRDRLGLVGQQVTVEADQSFRGQLTAIDFEQLELDGSRRVRLAIVRHLTRLMS